MILYKGMPTRHGNAVTDRIAGRQGNMLKPATVSLGNPNGYQTAGISTSADPAVAFVYACNYAPMPGGASIYAIWVDQGKFYRGKDVRRLAGIPANANMGATIRDQSIINQAEHALQSVASHQIIGWYTVLPGDPNQLGAWNTQPHWRIYQFDQSVITQARQAIHSRVNQKYPGGLSHARRLTDIETLTGPNPGVGF